MQGGIQPTYSKIDTTPNPVRKERKKKNKEKKDELNDD